MVSAPDIAKLQGVVNLIKSESERLKQYLNSLPPAALERPSPCELWNVAEVIAHLVWFAETYGGMMERGLRGDTSPTEGFPTVPGTLKGPEVDQLYGQGAITRRRTLGENLLSAFRQTYNWLNEMLQGIGPEDWEKPCYHTRGIRPVSSFLPTIIQELAVHEWDIRSSVEPSTPLSAKSIPVLMERLPRNRRPWTLPFPTSSPSSGLGRYRFHLSGVAGGNWDVVVEGDKARMETSREGAAGLNLRGATDTFILLMYGRLKLGPTIASGRLTAEGNLDLVLDFDRWMAGH
ncbi:MAG TPA: maleylpyruvate isomerase N-terminal domain-containing protein [Dehalococcoidia bacterium]|nr:maleylpyruvate isomerase N-terminal domain-containing protein [Dehalococcoidia bacterium]